MFFVKIIFEVQLNSNKTRTTKFLLILGYIYDFHTENPPSQVLQINFCSASVCLSLALFYSITTCLFPEPANRPIEGFNTFFLLFVFTYILTDHVYSVNVCNVLIMYRYVFRQVVERNSLQPYIIFLLTRSLPD